MRPSLLVYLLLLSFLFYEAQAIRFKKGSAIVEHPKVHEGTLIKTSNGGVGEVILCKDGQCSGNCRKLVTKTTSSTTTTSKNDKSGGNKANPIWKGKLSSEQLGGKEEIFSVNSSPVFKHREATSDRFPDSLELAGMDYALAKRKPPIHN